MSTPTSTDITLELLSLFINQVLNEPDTDTALSNLSTFIGPNFYDYTTSQFGSSELVSLLLNRPKNSSFKILFTIAEDDKISFPWQQLDVSNNIIQSGIDIFKFSFFLQDQVHTAQITERWSFTQ